MKHTLLLFFTVVSTTTINICSMHTRVAALYNTVQNTFATYDTTLQMRNTRNVIQGNKWDVATESLRNILRESSADLACEVASKKMSSLSAIAQVNVILRQILKRADTVNQKIFAPQIQKESTEIHSAIYALFIYEATQDIMHNKAIYQKSTAVTKKHGRRIMLPPASPHAHKRRDNQSRHHKRKYKSSEETDDWEESTDEQ